VEYEFLDEENKKQIVDTQLTELEARHFSLMMAQPSQLTDPQQYTAWSQQKGVLEQTLINLRAKRNNMFDPIDTRTPNEGEYWDILTGKVKKIEEE
jgi:hypothetical protein